MKVSLNQIVPAEALDTIKTIDSVRGLNIDFDEDITHLTWSQLSHMALTLIALENQTTIPEGHLGAFAIHRLSVLRHKYFLK